MTIESIAFTPADCIDESEECEQRSKFEYADMELWVTATKSL